MFRSGPLGRPGRRAPDRPACRVSPGRSPDGKFPVVGTVCSRPGTEFFPAAGSRRSQAGNKLFPRREAIVPGTGATCSRFGKRAGRGRAATQVEAKEGHLAIAPSPTPVLPPRSVDAVGGGERPLALKGRIESVPKRLMARREIRRPNPPPPLCAHRGYSVDYGRCPEPGIRPQFVYDRVGWKCDGPLCYGETKNRTFVWWLDRAESRPSAR